MMVIIGKVNASPCQNLLGLQVSFHSSHRNHNSVCRWHYEECTLLQHTRSSPTASWVLAVSSVGSLCSLAGASGELYLYRTQPASTVPLWTLYQPHASAYFHNISLCLVKKKAKLFLFLLRPTGIVGIIGSVEANSTCSRFRDGQWPIIRFRYRPHNNSENSPR